MKIVNVALGAFALSCLLVACGGGGTSAGNADVFSQPHPVATGAGTLADMAVPTPRQAAAARTPDASSFLNWAESAYPAYFPPAQSNKTVDVWTYRYYPQTDIYLGTNTGGDILGLVGKGGGAYDSVPLGKIADFGCLVYPSDCAVVAQPGTVSTLAGTGSSGFVNGTGTGASFYIPQGVAVDSSGNVFVGDTYNHAIRKITPAGVVSTLAGNGSVGFVNGTGTAASFNWPQGVAVDSSGNVFVADKFNNAIRKITPAGVVSTFAGGGPGGLSNGTGTGASFYIPTGVAVDSSGNVFVADQFNSAIRKITPAGVVSTFAGGTSGFVNGTGTAARFSLPRDVAVDSNGNVFVADQNNHAIRKITPAGVVSTFAGGTAGFVNGTGSAASFYYPEGVAVDSSGNVFVGDALNNAIRKITPAGIVSTFAGNGTQGFVNGTGAAASFLTPTGVAVDSIGNVIVADQNNHALRKITP
jgi:streptogramin lyase